MDDLTLLITSVIVVLISIWFAKREKKRLLPGPYGLPIVGYLPFMTSKPYVKLTELSKKYGPVFRVRLGAHDVVILTEFKLIKEAFAKDAFFGRPSDIPFEFSDENIELQAFFGMPWKEMRRFCLQQLRDLGLGKSRMEIHMKEEIDELVTRLTKNSQSTVKLSDFLAPSASNNIASFVFGHRMQHDDPKRQELDEILSTAGRLAGALSWTVFFPWIAAFCRKFRIGNRGKLVEAILKEKDFCREEISKHESTLDPAYARDFIDGFLIEMNKSTDNKNSIYKKEILIDMALAFFGAGSETVRITVDWVILVAAAFPDVQTKMQKEIDEALGRDGFANWEDRHRMPYTEAVIMETMRWKTSLPINLMRSTLADTELNGYHIPKDTRVLAIFWASDHDKSLWGNNAYEFQPKRFLNEDGTKVNKPEYFIPFSIGKRTCPGKSLGEIEVFLFVTRLLQKFKFSIPPGKEADLDGFLGISLQPKRQDLCIELR